MKIIISNVYKRVIGVIVAYKGGPGSGNFGHVGRPGEVGGSAPTIKDTIDQLHRSEYKGDFTSGYFILPNDKLVDVGLEHNGEETTHIGVIQQHPKMFGLDSDFPLENKTAVLANAIKNGAIRVRFYDYPAVKGGRQSFVSINTYEADTRTLRRLQRLYDVNKLIMADTVTWETDSALGKFTWVDFINAKYVSIGNESWGTPEIVLKEIIEKGGPGSGHWGHMGIIGQLGGSAPKGAGMSLRTGPTADIRRRATKALAQNAEKYAHLEWKKEISKEEWIRQNIVSIKANDIWNDIYSVKGGPKADLATFATNAFDMSDPDTGLHSEISKIAHSPRRYGENTLFIHGNVYDETGPVGEFTRIIVRNGTEIEVHNEYFRIDEQYKGSGFGSKFYQNAENVYMGQGIDKVTLSANIDVGGYAWARMGFDFAEPVELQDHQREAEGKWAYAWNTFKGENDPMPKMPTFTHAWELAAMKSPWDSHFPEFTSNPKNDTFGKYVLLGSEWGGIKYINPKTTGAKVGASYYESKKEKRKK